MFKKNLGLNCLNSFSELRITHRYDAEVDYCPTRRGVWLDRGEIDKIANTQRRFEEDHHTTNIIVGEIVVMKAITIMMMTMMMIITIVAMVQGEGEEDF